MAWPREGSGPRINADSRRVGLVTLVVGGLLVAGLLIMLVPIEEHSGSSRFYCGTPLSAAFKSPHDYLVQGGPTASPRRYVDYVPTPGGRSVTADCVSDGRIRTTIGGAVIAVALLGCAGLLVRARRNRLSD
jgi:hypothetical protein